MWFAILGPIQVHDGEMPVDVPNGRQRVLLAALLIHAGNPVPVDALAEAVWDGAPSPGAEVTLRSHVQRLRGVLGPRAGARLMTGHHSYLLQAGDDEVDALRFRRLCRDGSAALRDAAWERADRLLSEALDLWRGVPLADVGSEWLRRDEGQNLEALWLQAEEWQTDAALHLSRHDELIPGLQSLTARHPLRERFHGQLMLALYRCGRPAEALAAYQRARDVLVRELGTDPGPELQELHQRILSADPALSALEPPRPGQAELQRNTPRELPPTVPGFTGRSAELRALTRLLDGPRDQVPEAVVISAIGGTAGVGKTAIAVHWAHQVADRFPDGQLYVNLRGYDPAQPVPATDALAAFLRSLGVPGQDIPSEEAERAARYRSLLASKRLLIVLDNARTADQVRPLLPGTPGCTVVVTSRDALAGLVARDGATRLDLDVLPAEDAVALLRALIGARVDAARGAATELARHCCRLPLALRVAAELAVSRPALPLTALTSELADLLTRLDLLASGGDPHTEVRTVFSWSYRYLDTGDARAFRLLGLHPGADFEPYATAALTGMTVPQARLALDVLARAYLIQQAPPGRYGMHDLLRGYARELTAGPDAGQEQQTALTRLFDYYLHAAGAAMDVLYPAEGHRRPRLPEPSVIVPPMPDPAAARDWLDRERANLTAVARAAGNDWPGHVTRLAATLFRYLVSGAHFPQAVLLHGHARDAARRTGNLTSEAEALTSLGLVDARQGRYEQASSHLHQGLALYRRTHDQAGEARALNNLGAVEYYLGHYERAGGLHRQVLAICRRTHDQLGEAFQLDNIGAVEARQGHYAQAADLHRQALALKRELGRGAIEIDTLNNLGDTEARLGRYEQATIHLQQALDLCRQTGYRETEVHVLLNLGGAALRQGCHQQAAAYFREALPLSRDIGVPAAEAEALTGLGNVLLATSQPRQARSYYAAALDLTGRIGEKFEGARAHDGLGSSFQATGETTLARRHWQQALALFAELGVPEAGPIRAKLTEAPVTSG